MVERMHNHNDVIVDTTLLPQSNHGEEATRMPQTGHTRGKRMYLDTSLSYLPFEVVLVQRT